MTEICDCLKQVKEITDPRIIAETMWMADRPRTWYEWFRWTFVRKWQLNYEKTSKHTNS
jgi:hypothetical protein